MVAELIDGKKIADELRKDLFDEIARLKATKGDTPTLAVLLIGDNPASHTYVGMKEKACQEMGIRSFQFTFPKTVEKEEIFQLIKGLNERADVDGILVQLPLPEQLPEAEVLTAIAPEKDVDGFHPYNVGRLLIGRPTFVPCTPYGVQMLLIKSGVETKGKHAVIVGRSNIVGKPMAAILMQKAVGANATVTICHTATPDIGTYSRQADILIVAAGRANTITADMVKPGAIVIDVGVNRVDAPTSPKGYRLVGDVDFEGVKEVAGKITPVPGGVGPMTITMLLHNTLLAFKRRRGIS